MKIEEFHKETNLREGGRPGIMKCMEWQNPNPLTHNGFSYILTPPQSEFASNVWPGLEDRLLKPVERHEEFDSSGLPNAPWPRPFSAWSLAYDRTK